EDDTVAVVSPSWGGPASYPRAYEYGIDNLQDLCGVKVKEYPTARMSAEDLRKTPWLRAEDLSRAFADADVKAIIASIGGEDSVRILPFLDVPTILANPKILMGYSDTTTLTSYLNLRGVATFNGPSIMGGFTCLRSVEPAFGEHIKDILMRPTPIYHYCPYERYVTTFQDWGSEIYRAEVTLVPNSTGFRWLQGDVVAQGRLFGGNIEVLEFLKGTDFWPPMSFWEGKILFLETSEEKPPVSNVRYMLRNYGMQGVFDKISALLFARAYRYEEQEKEELERQIVRVVRDEFGRADLPIVANMDFGHDMPQLIIPLGVTAEVDCIKKTVRLLEPAVE
ncbi:MAG TPA: S66 peptidase family protein, partial [Capsulimonadaceae bacterium]|nr:S66 peptidase family protein [Capsulimonadaceae bacterium]